MGNRLSLPASANLTEYWPVSAALPLFRADLCPAHMAICTKMGHGPFEAGQIIHNDPRTALKVMKAQFGSYGEKVSKPLIDNEFVK